MDNLLTALFIATWFTCSFFSPILISLQIYTSLHFTVFLIFMIRGRFGRNRNIEERTISCNTKDLRHHNSIKNSWWDAAMKVWHANNKKSKVVTFVKQFRWYFTITYSDIQINKSSVRSRMYQFSTSSLE